MTFSDDDLRRALTLLEQRRPAIDLAHPATRRSRPGPRWGLALAASLLVVLLALILALIDLPRTAGPATHTGTTRGGIAGYTWLVISVRTPTGSVDLQQDHPGDVNVNSGNAWMQFISGGTYVASDGLTVTSGTYRARDGRLILTAASPWGPTYPDPGRYTWAKLVTAAIDAVSKTGTDTHTAITGDVLILAIPGYEVRLRRASLDLGQPKSSSCPPGANCAPPILAAATGVHLSIGNHRYNLSPAQAASVPLRIGDPVTITIRIDRPVSLEVSNMFLSVNSYPSGSGPNGPTGKERTLIHHPGPIALGDSVATTWTPQILYGTDNLDLTVEYGIGKADIGYAVAHLRLHS